MKYKKLLFLILFFSTYSFNASLDMHTTPCKIIASGSYNIHTDIAAIEKTNYRNSITPPIVEFIQYPDKSFPGYCLLLFNKERRAEFEKNPLLSDQPHLIYFFPNPNYPTAHYGPLDTRPIGQANLISSAQPVDIPQSSPEGWFNIPSSDNQFHVTIKDYNPEKTSSTVEWEVLKK